MSLTKTHWFAIAGMVLLLAVIIAGDLYLLSNEIKGDTISALIVEGGRRIAIIPFAIGALAAHLVLKQKRDNVLWEVLGLLPGLGLAMTALNWTLGRPGWFAAAALTVGLAAGAAFWPNKGAEGE
jgi:peptidoglycan/LPS O-acetylase OafA/YrhL